MSESKEQAEARAWAAGSGRAHVIGRALLAIVVFAVAAWSYYCQVPNTTVADRDEYKHLIVARSLAHGTGLNPRSPRPIQYPPGWGATLFLVQRVFGERLEVAHALTSLLAWSVGLLTFLYLLGRTGFWLSLAMGALCSAHVLSVRMGDTLLSEPIFAAAWMGGLFLMRRADGLRWHRWLLIGVAVALCMSFRTIGVALWIGAGVNLAITSRARPRARLGRIASLSLAPVAWLIILTITQPAMGISPGRGYGWQFLHERASESHGPAVSLAVRTARDAPNHVRDFTAALVPVEIPEGPWSSRLVRLAALGIIVLAFVGWVRCVRRAPGPMEYALAAYLAICFVWPYFGPRFFWPVVPLCLYYACAGILGPRPGEKAGKGGFAAVALAFAAAAAISFCSNLPHATAGREGIAGQVQGLRDAVAEAKRSPDLGDAPMAAISCFKVFYYFPGARVCALDYTDKPEAHLAAIRECRARWLLVDVGQLPYFKPLIAGHRSQFEMRFTGGGVSLWQVAEALARGG